MVLLLQLVGFSCLLHEAQAQPCRCSDNLDKPDSPAPGSLKYLPDLCHQHQQVVYQSCKINDTQSEGKAN